MSGIQWKVTRDPKLELRDGKETEAASNLIKATAGKLAEMGLECSLFGTRTP